MYVFLVGILNSTVSLSIPVWQDTWTNFLISPYISILNLITAIYNVFSSTMDFVFELIAMTLASSMVAIKLFGQLFLNVMYYFTL